MKKDVTKLGLGSVMLIIARGKTGVTQKELAKKINSSQDKIGNYERGQTEPKPSVLDDCIKALEGDFLAIYTEAKAAMELHGSV